MSVFDVDRDGDTFYHSDVFGRFFSNPMWLFSRLRRVVVAHFSSGHRSQFPRIGSRINVLHLSPQPMDWLIRFLDTLVEAEAAFCHRGCFKVLPWVDRQEWIW